ncbi:armadillo-type protein [Podospora fimiseda]|uniref:Armadillo-type protein n=1 Tax=Podospora fimiseda TaxID=252190 RepID=A0AAN7GZZ2_9PEZI|nr:armadillo-type protein [Podospora fimiseda]
MAPRRSAAAEPEEQEEEGDLVALKFNEPLTWRAGKAIALDTLLRRLSTLAKELEEMDQEVTDTNSLTKIAKEVASHQLLTHKDKGVRAYAACCVVDILKLCAPDAPFTPTQMKEIFHLTITSIIPALFDPSNPYNTQHKYVLRSLTEIKSIVLLLDVDGNEDLLVHLFSTIFDGVSGAKSTSGEQVAKDVEFTMAEMLVVLVDEATSLPAKVVDVLMAQFLRAAAPGVGSGKRSHVPIDDTQPTLLAREEPEAYQIAKKLCQSIPEKMSRFASQYFSEVIVDATSSAGRPIHHRDADESEDEDGPSGPSESDLRELRKAHTLIRELWKAAPQILQGVVQQVDAELAADNVHLRQLATETLGDMVSGIGAAGPPPPPVLDPAAYPPPRLEGDGQVQTQPFNVLTTPVSAVSFPQTHSQIFHNFISRKNDKAPAIRAAWTTGAGYIISTSAGGTGLSREDEATLVKGLGEKLADSDERVRLAAVKAIESFTFEDVVMKLGASGGVTKEGSVLSTLADRCRDRKPAVRVAAMALLGKLWAVSTGELLAGNEIVASTLGGVPTRIYSAFYANDPELNVLLDRVIFECLVPLTYPPQKKASKNANGSSQSQSQAAAADPDAIRAERILLLARSLDPMAKKAFFAMQARVPQFANVLSTYIKQCEHYNGGVMDDNAEKKKANLQKTIQYISQFLPNSQQVQQDLFKFAKINDRRNRILMKYVIGQEHDFKTVHNALKELFRRIQSSKESGISDTLLPLLYRSGSLLFNRSHLSTIMDYSRSDKDGMGQAAQEILKEISQHNPDLFKAHIGQLCKDLVDQAPSATQDNDPIVAETLKACSTYSRKYPKDVPMDKEFIQTMINFALYGRPAKVAKHAVNILLSKKDSKSDQSAADLIQRIMKDWKYGSPHFLNKIAAVSQLELVAPKVTHKHEENILNMTVQQLLLVVRKDAKDRDPNWVDDADLDEECQAKLLALKTLANRLRSMEVSEAKEKASPVWKLLMKLIREKGEICKTNDTPAYHRSRLRLVAAQLLLKLCTQKHFDEILSADEFNALALTTQDAVQEVRHGFVRKLQKYLAQDKLRSRFYTIVFLLAFEPNAEFKQRTETWIRSRARHFQGIKQPVLEAIMARLPSLLAHHPDYSPAIDELVDHARYILFYISLVATESNLGHIYKYAERVKQTHDALDPKSQAHQLLCDLAMAVIRKWQEKKNWAFRAHPDKVGLPLGLYTALRSHSEAQEIAEKQLVPEKIDEKLDELLRAMDKKKKRKPANDSASGESRPAAKKSRVQPKDPKAAKESKSGSSKSSASRKIATPKTKKSSSSKSKRARSPAPVSDANRRRSGRSAANASYIERDSSEDDEEMLEGVAEWEYEDGEEQESGSENESAESGSGGESEQEASEKEVEVKKGKSTEKKNGKEDKMVVDDDGDLSEPGDDDVEMADKEDDKQSESEQEAEEENEKGEEEAEDKQSEEEGEDEEEEAKEATPPPSTRASRSSTNGRRVKTASTPVKAPAASKTKSTPATAAKEKATPRGKKAASPAASKTKAAATVTKNLPTRTSGRSTRGRAAAAE